MKDGKSADTESRFHFAVLSDTHIIDKFYKPGSENGVEDNESILKANDRLVIARDTLNKIRFSDGSRIEQYYLPGDVFHNYPSADYDFYFQNETRLDIAKKLLSGFEAPVRLGWGNHDYDVPRVSREMSHKLFEAKFQTAPYWSQDYRGFRFLMLNNFLGATWDKNSPNFHKDVGSLGEEQLQWLEAQLAERKPTVVFIHYPLCAVAPVEVKDFGLHPLLRRYQNSIQMVIAGHWHKWIDFAHTYGPQHTIIASTRYNERAYMVFQADPREGTIRWLDEPRVDWSTHYAEPYPLG
ncbi:MAG: metallophosphoesterase [Acidobacteriaceae bacterium]|nr:metallophosphoesterase [Acidobacteriaceae bacterium]